MYFDCTDESRFQKQVVLNCPSSSWAALCLGGESIKTIPSGFLHDFLRHDSGASLRRNFTVLNEFFASLGHKNQVSSVKELKEKSDGMWTVNLCVDLRTELAHWQKNLVHKCVSCDEQVNICPCQRFYSHPCTETHTFLKPDCPKCQDFLYGTHLLQIQFADAKGDSIQFQFNETTADTFYNKFTSDHIVSNHGTYVDFVSTLHWHVDRFNCGSPFLQNIVVKKVTSGSTTSFLYVSGCLQPTMDTDGYA